MVKVCIVATAAIESPPNDSYAGVEQVSWSLAEGLAKMQNQVWLITTNESSKLGVFSAKDPSGNEVGRLEVKAAGPKDWGPQGERNMFVSYHQWLEQEFGEGQGVVIDYSWGGWPYCLAAGKLGLAKHPNMKIMHLCHAMANWFDPTAQKFVVPPVPFPRLCGVSAGQAVYLSAQYGVPVKYLYNGITLPPKPEPVVNGNYLLSLNRISIEKGIHNCIDVAFRTNNKIKLVGADSWVDQKYVSDIYDKCWFSNGQAEYYGHVDTQTKWELLKQCKALVACPDPSRYVEAFGIYAVEALAMCKPVVALRNGGLQDIIQNGVNGFLCANVDEMVEIIKSGRLDSINPENCRISAERFTVENMCANYQQFINGIMSDSNEYKW